MLQLCQRVQMLHRREEVTRLLRVMVRTSLLGVGCSAGCCCLLCFLPAFQVRLGCVLALLTLLISEAYCQAAFREGILS